MLYGGVVTEGTKEQGRGAREKSALDFVDTSIHRLAGKRWAKSHV